ncbi:putative ubiquitinyl hydrolase 1 [Helianthus annuus]|uniref:Putative TRAF-like protein n=1 Tax=Helianthus annuus TaxID=4232 RepID=A0A251TBZ1_HELAN|nr:putative ubiquitinyl hydrolase 1 [Helianthus annuus]
MAIGESCSQASLPQGDLRSTSEAPPAHYILNIQQFSSLTKHNVERYESNEFEAGGYKWKLVIHPNGNKSKKVGEFMSVYLAMADTTSLAPGWEVYGAFKIFLLDQNNDTYLKLEDERINGRRFHRLRTEWGFDQFISLEEFGDSNTGPARQCIKPRLPLWASKSLGPLFEKYYVYILCIITLSLISLFNLIPVVWCCVFGAEVYVHKERSKGKTESLSMVKDAVIYKRTWRISNYTKVIADCESSNVFNIGDHKWKLQLYPNGKGGIGGYISLKLALAEPEKLPSGTKILAEFTLRMVDQLDSRHYSGKGICILYMSERWVFWLPIAVCYRFVIKIAVTKMYVSNPDVNILDCFCDHNLGLILQPIFDFYLATDFQLRFCDRILSGQFANCL